MSEELRVYLDHFISRENLRYKRSDERLDNYSRTQTNRLRMIDLYGDHLSSRVKTLCKPDFQRATWAWTPEDCVSLLDTVVNGQVIPSIIMWYSPDSNRDYVLDGGHRLSVVMAWLADDWGDSLPRDYFEDDQQLEEVKEAAHTVRSLVRAKVGAFDDYSAAADEFDRLVDQGLAPRALLTERDFKRAQFYNQFKRGDVEFSILWVNGNYETAEQSFLKINKSGKQLSEWETKLVENRDSSFARAVMSISSVASAQHYWPSRVPDGADKQLVEQTIPRIIAGVEAISSILFDPPPQSTITRLTQPIMAVFQRPKKPYRIAELLTVIQGGKGQSGETDKLLREDRSAGPEVLINNGLRLIVNAQDGLAHLTGPSPKSLAVIPAVYFYSEAGRYVRSLLYGFIYWLLQSNDDATILNRKRVFCAHRAAFERVLVEFRGGFVSGISRRTGSGPEVTSQTAKYYQELLELLIKHRDEIDSAEFQEDYKKLNTKLAGQEPRKVLPSESKSRTFTPQQKSTLRLDAILSSTPRCGICNAMIDPQGDLQHDHIVQFARGGRTSSDNQRLVHPFCNNQANREVIEAIRSGQQVISLPAFFDEAAGQQMSFLNDPGFW